MSKSELRRLSIQTGSVITEEDKLLMEEIRKNPKAYQKLKDKAKWEHMTTYGVLKEWGDPREW
jgi:hypothetical protein